MADPITGLIAGFVGGAFGGGGDAAEMEQALDAAVAEMVPFAGNIVIGEIITSAQEDDQFIPIES